MEAVERDNPSLKDVLPKDYARPALDKQRLVLANGSMASNKSARARSARPSSSYTR
jgi:hypothetical protein